MSVGSYTGPQGAQRALAQIWNGKKWKTVSAVSARAAFGTSLQGVSCVSSRACVAVGYSLHPDAEFPAELSPRTFAERWNGSSWRAITPPGFGISAAKSTELTSVSCASATVCTAVGTFTFESGPQTPNGPGLLLTWNGKRWSRSSVPGPRKASLALSSVSCTSGGACFVAGSYVTNGKPDLPFVVSRPRASAAWHYSTLPAPFPTTPAALKAGKDFDLASSSVSCPKPTACTLVGSWRHEGTGVTDFPIYSEVWNGRRWRLVRIANPRPQSELDSVSCWTATSCLAIGTTGNGETNKVLTERRSGSGWTRIGGPPSLANQGDRVLACRSATWCLAVGSVYQHGPRASLLQGTTWRALTVPSPPGTLYDSLADVSCASASTCTAVGSYAVGSSEAVADQRTLIESGGPGKWSLSPAPSPAGVFASELSSVSCPTATFCMTIGQTFQTLFSSFTEPLAEVRRGASWQVVTTPDPHTNYGSTLQDISCASASFCVGVGEATQNTGASKVPVLVDHQLVEQWNGSSWHIVAVKGPAGVTTSHLSMVSCPSATSCTAIGDTTTGRGAPQPLAESFDGHSWRQLSDQGLSTGIVRLSCTSGSFCMAVGGSGYPEQPVVQSWNGTAWETLGTPSPSPAGGGNIDLNDVSCTWPTACTAVGSNMFEVAGPDGPDLVDHPFADTWNGTTWSPANLPVPGATLGTTLTGISCTAARHCMTAGATSTGGSSAIPVIESHG